MNIETLSTSWALANTTVMTDTSFPSRIPTVTEPTKAAARAVVDCGYGGSQTCNALEILIIDDGANDAVITGLRAISWNVVPAQTPTLSLWVPHILCEFAAVLGNITGVANSIVDTSFFFADTITLVTGNANISNEIVSPTGDVIAHAIFDIKGAQKVEFTVDLGASATGTKILYKKL